MGAAAKVGGVLSLIGGALVLVQSLLALLAISITGNLVEQSYIIGAAADIIWPIMSLMLGALALIGGILAMAEKKAGGAIALIVSILWILFPLLLYFGVIVTFLAYMVPMSLLTNLLGVGVWIFTIEGLLVLVGGILGLTAGE